MTFQEQTTSDNIRLLFLAHDQEIPDQALMAGVSPATLRTSQEIKHPARRREFLRARYLVRQALGLSVDPSRDADGVIIWPPGFNGSVSHSLGHIGLATSGDQSFAAIGFDLEHISRVSPALCAKICTPREAKMVDSGELSLVEVFVAKEALFKCHFPLGRKRFWFHDAEIIAAAGDPSSRRMDLSVLIDTGPTTPAGFITQVRVSTGPFADVVQALAVLPK